MNEERSGRLVGFGLLILGMTLCSCQVPSLNQVPVLQDHGVSGAESGVDLATVLPYAERSSAAYETGSRIETQYAAAGPLFIRDLEEIDMKVFLQKDEEKRVQ